MVFPRPAGPCLCGHSSSSSWLLLLSVLPAVGSLLAAALLPLRLLLLMLLLQLLFLRLLLLFLLLNAPQSHATAVAVEAASPQPASSNQQALKKWKKEYFRRPRQAQGGARQGIILLSLVLDYYRSRRSSSKSS